ncbi:MAG: vWA domain-containing protein [Isosphaeraceae bacterium]
MDQPLPTRDPLEGLRFTFKSDEAFVEPPPPPPEPEAAENQPDARDRLHFGETPMTDPRSLFSSVLVHLLLVGVASLAVLNVVASRELTGPTALQGELEPVDNRAGKNQNAGSGIGGGGSPGEIGGMGSIAFVAPKTETDPQRTVRDPTADALLSELLPSTTSKDTELFDQALPGPRTSGVGLIPGSGTGGGGGSGGGSGGGIGRGIGPGTEFFGAREHGRSFAYVIDCSGSMATRGSLNVAKRELLASLNPLPPDARFSVIFYNLNVRVFTDPQGNQGMMPATTSNKTRVEAQLRAVGPDGGTDHMLALRTALGLRPEVIFFLTDADLMTNSDVDQILAEAHGSRIQAVEFSRGTDLGMETPLRRMARATGGTYRYIDVTSFPKTAEGY